MAGKKTVKAKVEDVASDDESIARAKARKEALTLEAGLKSKPAEKDIIDQMRRKEELIKSGNITPERKAEIEDAIRADYRRILEIASKNKEIACAAFAIEAKESNVFRDSVQPIRLITLEVDTASTSSTSVNAAISSSFVDAEGNVDDNERSTGIIPKEDKIASLSIMSLTGKTRATIREFFITGVAENTSEKFQIVQTFGSDHVFFFNRKPLVYTINGILHNSSDKQWKNNFRENYDNFLRGTKLVEGRNKAVLQYEDVLREGYLLSLNYHTDSQNPHAIPFSFSMFITKESRTGEKRVKDLSEDQSATSSTAESTEIIIV
jgi:hypothetical protein